MRMRLDATTRSPASSSILVTAPVRLRRVASGLMIEKVRVAALTGRSPEIDGMEFGRSPRRANEARQASRLFHPFAAIVRPIAPLDPLASQYHLPREPLTFQR